MTPYLSFVVAARNDNYAGNFLHRMQVFVNVLLGLWARHSLDAELVIVEWNPPRDRPRLKDAVGWPKDLRPRRIRIIEVPSELHRQIPNSDKMPMFEYRAKNVGVRRARGEYVLVTNPDILFSRRLLRHMAPKDLSEDCFYRADRYDVAKTIPAEIPADRQLRFCARHSIRIQKLGETVPVSFTKRSYRVLHRNMPRLYPRRLVRGLLRRLASRFSLGPVHSNNGRFPVGQVHLNASGDFMLMARSKWFSLRGYPELSTHSHIDSYLAVIAAVSGLRQIILPYPIYHQEHDRSEQTIRPLTVLEELREFRRMVETGSLVITNGENWGLGEVTLPEEGM